MAKYVKKSKLEFKNGSIVKKSTVVAVDLAIVSQYNRLEELLQRAVYLGEQPDYQPRPSLDGFEFVSIKDLGKFDVEKPETPAIDKKLEEAMQFYEEVESLHKVDGINEVVQQFHALLEFCDNDEVLIGTGDVAVQMFDGFMLGNPLELTVDKVMSAIKLVASIDMNENGELV